MMRFKEFKLFIVIFLLVSCNDNDIPKDILPPEKMQEVMWDYLRADVFTTDFISKDSAKNVDFENIQIQKKIFEKYKISKDIFYKSLSYYEANPSLMQVMMDSMITQKRRITDSIKVELNQSKGRRMTNDLDTTDNQSKEKNKIPDTFVFKGKLLKKKNLAQPQ